MGKAGEVALYLVYCDFYPFRANIENNKMAFYVIGEIYRQKVSEASVKDNFISEQWAMTCGTFHSCRVDLLTQYSLLLTIISLLEESLNTLCHLYHDMNHLYKELKDTKGSGLERTAKYLKEVVEKVFYLYLWLRLMRG